MKEKKYQEMFFIGFILCLIICLSPSNTLAYLSPFILLLWLCIVTRDICLIRNLFIFIFCYLLLLVLFIFLSSDFIPGNSLLAVFTYGSFIPILTIPTKYFINKDIFFRMLKILSTIVILESILGIIQGIYGFSKSGSFDLGNGDYIEGTIHPQLYAEGSFSNPIFAIILGISIIFLFYHYRINKLGRIALVLGIITFILASVLHAILFFILACISSYILFYVLKPIKIKLNIKFSTVIIIISIVTFFIFGKISLSTNIKGIIPNTLWMMSKSPKIEVMNKFYSQTSKDYPLAPLIGLGPGQFLSRASLISTGEYFRIRMENRNFKIPFTEITKPFKLFGYDLWVHSITGPWGRSSLAKPQSSWNAMLTEFGIIGFILSIWFIIFILYKVKMKLYNDEQRVLAFTFGWALIFIFLLGFQENYWETTQTIFIGLLLLKVSYCLLIYNYNERYIKSDKLESVVG